MKHTSRYVWIAALLMLVGVSLHANVIRERPTANSSGGHIIIRWYTVDETGVQRFEVLRRAGTTGDFVIIGIIDQLKGNNSMYEFIDKDAFKVTAGIYQYKIRVINGQNPPPETEIVTVSHLSSAARRTWGSIKAMFR
jgi:hypothetical protein